FPQFWCYTCTQWILRGTLNNVEEQQNRRFHSGTDAGRCLSRSLTANEATREHSCLRGLGFVTNSSLYRSLEQGKLIGRRQLVWSKTNESPSKTGTNCWMAGWTFSTQPAV